MADTERNTLEQIHKAAKAEFLEKGFKSASLRNIVKTAGVTTGAFYGYYKSKEELFGALVGKQYDVFMKKFKDTQNAFACLCPEDQKRYMGVQSAECMDWMTDYAYDNFEEFRLLLCCSDGTKYGNMVHEMVEIEISATRSFAKVMESLGNPAYNVDPMLEHMLVSGMFSAYFEMFIHDMPRENAKEYVRQLRNFHMAGWKEIMGF